eukprot:7803711-Alexandrium_andersonii.AAC.1
MGRHQLAVYMQIADPLHDLLEHATRPFVPVMPLTRQEVSEGLAGLQGLLVGLQGLLVDGRVQPGSP